MIWSCLVCLLTVLWASRCPTRDIPGQKSDRSVAWIAQLGQCTWTTSNVHNYIQCLDRVHLLGCWVNLTVLLLLPDTWIFLLAAMMYVRSGTSVNFPEKRALHLASGGDRSCSDITESSSQVWLKHKTSYLRITLGEVFEIFSISLTLCPIMAKSYLTPNYIILWKPLS